MVKECDQFSHKSSSPKSDDVCKKFLKDKTKNPLTNRTIKKDGPTYKKLEKECKDELPGVVVLSPRYGNLLISLPAGIGNLVNLQELFCSDNRITSLPAEIGLLTNLQDLRCDRNRLKIEDIPINLRGITEI